MNEKLKDAVMGRNAGSWVRLGESYPCPTVHYYEHRAPYLLSISLIGERSDQTIRMTNAEALALAAFITENVKEADDEA